MGELEILDIVGENGVQVTRSLKYTVPLGTAPGTLYFTVADGTLTGLAELKQIIAETPTSAEQSISTVGRLRPSDKAYVRVWRADGRGDHRPYRRTVEVAGRPG